MNTDLVPFVFDGHEVRTVVIDGEPWVVAADICAVLELDHVAMAVKGLRKDDLTKVAVIDAIGRIRPTLVVNEPGLYRLILRSNKTEADRFQDWICRGVLPAIRRTGKYSVDLRGWLSSGPKPWTKTFPDRFYTEILRLHGKDPERVKEQEPWIAQLTDFLIYNRIEQGLRETLVKINPIPSGQRWRRHKHHQHFSDQKAERQLQLLIAECIGALAAAEGGKYFCGE
jgi:hypothetical protein